MNPSLARTAQDGAPAAVPDDEFLAAFESCALGPDEFHHADHVRGAFKA